MELRLAGVSERGAKSEDTELKTFVLTDWQLPPAGVGAGRPGTTAHRASSGVGTDLVAMAQEPPESSLA